MRPSSIAWARPANSASFSTARTTDPRDLAPGLANRDDAALDGLRVVIAPEED
jgi:hypothetical protein